MMRALALRLRRFVRDTDGAALVEFALVLPVMIAFFAVTIEGARLMTSYQSAIAGVRDATRYVGRVVQPDICTKGADISDLQDRITLIVRNSADGRALFADGITIDRVVPVLTCYGGAYRQSQTPVATITADMTITWPFSGIFVLFGGVPPVTRVQIADTGRVFGA